jgi:hypothetical protein
VRCWPGTNRIARRVFRGQAVGGALYPRQLNGIADIMRSGPGQWESLLGCAHASCARSLSAILRWRGDDEALTPNLISSLAWYQRPLPNW